ncbi:MAG: hypothetical protein Q9225_001038 [Loekoesia sp. 1 TL-2023]
MAPDVQESPFVKQLASSGLWHTPSPHASQRLCSSLSVLLLLLPPSLFIRFLFAFWTTITSNYSSIPALRLDKYLLLIRYYVRDSFLYLKSHSWEKELLKAWTEVMEGKEDAGKEGWGPLSSGNAKVPDGVRYHVLDVWIDELEGVVGEEGIDVGMGEMLMEPVKRLEREGRTKVVRRRAKEILEDERVRAWLKVGEEVPGNENEGGDDEEWNGFED